MRSPQKRSLSSLHRVWISETLRCFDGQVARQPLVAGRPACSCARLSASALTADGLTPIFTSLAVGPCSPSCRLRAMSVCPEAQIHMSSALLNVRSGWDSSALGRSKYHIIVRPYDTEVTRPDGLHGSARAIATTLSHRWEWTPDEQDDRTSRYRFAIIAGSDLLGGHRRGRPQSSPTPEWARHLVHRISSAGKLLNPAGRSWR